METLSIHPELGDDAQKFEELLAIVQKMELLGESDELTREEIMRESKVLVTELLSHLDSDLHLNLSENIGSLYAEMQRENLIARVEQVASVLKCLATNEPISVGSQDTHYANSVTADPEGLRIAMSEADALGPVRLLVGLDLKALIGFTTDHLSVSEIDDSELDLRDTNLRKNFCRHVSGEIHRDDIRYVVMRIPKAYFPQDSLTPEEEKMSGQFVFRGARLPKEIVGDDILEKAA